MSQSNAKSMFTSLPGAARIEVDNIEIEDNEENLKVSPYLYHDGMYFKCKGRKDVPFVLLNSILKENLPSLYFDLLCILSDYTYLNSFLLRKRLAYLKNHEEMSITGMRRTLNAMRQKGLILEYELFHQGEDQSIKGSPFIYAVSPLGCKYLKKSRPYKFIKNEEQSIPFECERVLRILSENQFSILFEEQYEPCGRVTYCDFSDFVYKNSGIRMLYGIKLPSNDVIALFAFSIRQDPQWSSRYLMLLRNLRTFMEKQQIKNASIMVIVESEWFSMACERVRCCENDLKNLDVFYATDVSFVTESDVFNRLIDVLPANDYSKRSIFRLNIRNSEQ